MLKELTPSYELYYINFIASRPWPTDKATVEEGGSKVL